MAKASKFSSATRKKNGLKKDYSILPAKMPGFWSYSRFSAWDTESGGCPFFYLLAYVHKVPQPPSFALERGTDIHAKAEGYLKGRIRGLPKELAHFRKEFQAVKKAEPMIEQSITLTKTWGLTHATDWGRAWLRTKLDILVLDEDAGTMIDIKTGKNRGSYSDQEEIYALSCFVAAPELVELDTEYWFVDSGEVESNSFTRDELPALKKKWRANAKKMLTARTFKPNAGCDKCRYCPYRSDKELPNGEPGICDGWKKQTK